MSLTNDTGQNQTAIGRAYAGEPISLLVLSDNGLSAVVVGEQERAPRPTGFKKEWLYQFKADLFVKLRKAYERRKTEELTRLWANAEPWRPAS